MNQALIYTKLLTLPEHMRREVSDFVDFLIQKTHQKTSKNKAKFGSAKGMFIMKDNFDDPISDFC